MKYFRFIPLLMLGSIACLQIACKGTYEATKSAGESTVGYITNELRVTENVSMDRAWNATVVAIDQMGFIVKDKENDYVSARLDATTADSKQIRVLLKRIASDITQIIIRVDLFGDEALSRFILQQIQKNL